MDPELALCISRTSGVDKESPSILWCTIASVETVDLKGHIKKDMNEIARLERTSSESDVCKTRKGTFQTAGPF